MSFRYARVAAAVTVAMALLSGCAENVKEATPQVTTNSDDYFEVHKGGRLYVFDDAATYKAFLANGEAPYVLTRIGAGPKGQTVVFALAAKDKEKSSGIASVEMFEGKLKAGEAFYREVVVDGRIYVADNWSDLQSLRSTGEAPLRYTAIGAGPKGETVVYLLNQKTASKKPDALMARFSDFHR